MQTILLVLGGLLLIVAVVGFYVSFWGRQPKPENANSSHWANLTGGGHPPHHHSGSNHDSAG